MPIRVVALGVLAALVGCGRSFPVVSVPSTPATPPGPLIVTSVDPQAIAPLGVSQIVATGGVPPYHWLLLTTYPDGGPRGSIDGGMGTGTYSADATGPAQISILVVDSDGGAADVEIGVGLQVVITPSVVTVAPGGATGFSAQYGQPPYRFIAGSPACGPASTCASASIDSVLGIYTAGRDCGGATDCVVAIDSNDAGSAPAQITITQGPLISPASVALNAGAGLDLSVGGGVPPYTFAFARHGNLSGGSVTTDGRYQSGPNPNEVDTIQVVDSTGLISTAQITVGNPVVQLPNPTRYQLVSMAYSPVQTGELLAFTPTALAGEEGADLEVLAGSPSGLAIRQSLSRPIVPCRVDAADVNGDRRSDVLVVETNLLDGAVNDCNTVAVLLQQQDGSLLEGPRVDIVGSVSFGGPVGSLSAPIPEPSAPALLVVHQATFDDLGQTTTSLQFFGWVDGGLGPVAQLPVPSDTELPAISTLPVLATAESMLAYVHAEPTADMSSMVLELSVFAGLVAAPDGGVVLPLPEIRMLPGLSADPSVTRPTPGLADLNGDGLPDAYVYTLDEFVGGTLLAFLRAPGGALAADPITFALPAGDQLVPSISGVGLNVASLSDPDFLQWTGAALTLSDAGLVPSTSMVEESFHAAGLIERAFATPSGQVIEQEGDLPSGYATGNAFSYARISASGLPTSFAVGDLDGDGLSDVLAGGLGLAVFTGVDGGGLSTECAGTDTACTWLSDAEILAVTVAPSGGWALAIPPGQSEELVHFSWTDAGWSVQSVSLADAGFRATALTPMWAGGEVPGGDLLLSGQSSSQWVFQAFTYSGGVVRPSSLSAEVPLDILDSDGTDLDPTVVSPSPFSTDGGADDSLAVQVGILFDDIDQLASVEVADPVGAPPQWILVDGGFGDGDSPDSTGCQTNSLYTIQPLPLGPGQHPGRWLSLQSTNGSGTNAGTFADGGVNSSTGVCIFDPTTDATPVPTGVGAWGNTDYSVEDLPPPPVIGDIDGDGTNDLVALVYGQVNVARGLGSYQFAAPTPVLSLNGLTSTLWGLGDINGDGFGDAVIQVPETEGLFVLYGQPDGGLH